MYTGLGEQANKPLFEPYLHGSPYNSMQTHCPQTPFGSLHGRAREQTGRKRAGSGHQPP